MTMHISDGKESREMLRANLLRVICERDAALREIERLRDGQQPRVCCVCSSEILPGSDQSSVTRFYCGEHINADPLLGSGMPLSKRSMPNGK